LNKILAGLNKIRDSLNKITGGLNTQLTTGTRRAR